MDERTATFINSMDRDHPDYLEKIAEEAVREQVPIIRRDMQAYLRFLMRQQNPVHILEIGTAVGFSALLMREYAAESHIITIENYPPRLAKARENFSKYDKDGRIELMEGDAADILPLLADRGESFDFIFMDAAKGQYINFLPFILQMLDKGGLLVGDNVLQDGDIIESRYAVRRRDRTIHARMREYLRTIKSMEALETVILPVGDGCSVSLKIQNCPEDKNEEG